MQSEERRIDQVLRCSTLLWGMAVLCSWWSVWSLADVYLLPYTPSSEIVLLLVGILLFGLAVCASAYAGRGMRRGQWIRWNVARRMGPPRSVVGTPLGTLEESSESSESPNACIRSFV